AFVGVRPGHTDRAAVHDRERVAVDRVAVVESHEAAAAVIPSPAEDLDGGGGTADGEIADEQDIAVSVCADKRVAAVLGHIWVLGDVVREEPESGRGVAAVVKAVHGGVKD